MWEVGVMKMERLILEDSGTLGMVFGHCRVVVEKCGKHDEYETMVGGQVRRQLRWCDVWRGKDSRIFLRACDEPWMWGTFDDMHVVGEGPNCLCWSYGGVVISLLSTPCATEFSIVWPSIGGAFGYVLVMLYQGWAR